jgi:phosphoadenosine phosphosulfate reductase
MNDIQGVSVGAISEALSNAEAPCITSSFQAECVVLTHMLRTKRPDVPVLFLDTFHHFADTLTYRDEITQSWGLNLINLQAEAPHYDVWFTALRRDQSPSRAGLQEIEPFRLPSGKTIQRVSPLAAWTAKDVWAYAKQHAIPLLPLYDLGYTSIGCEPCTSLPMDPSNPRSGRWQGEKLECGIHVEVAKS